MKHPMQKTCQKVKINTAFVLVIAAYVVLAYCYAIVKPQWCDEVWAIIPAANLAFKGFLGMGDQTTLILPTINQEQRLYWYPPLSYWSMALWFKVFGYGLMQARWHSIAWAIVLFVGMFGMIRKPWMGIWAILICALDYNFLNASDARPEMMCAALGIWAIATRSAWFAAGAMLVHPFGIMYPIALACIKRKVEWLPYLVAAALWGIYISQDPILWWHTTINQYVVHFAQVAFTPGLGVYMATGTGWRLVLLAIYVGCSAAVALKQRDIALCLGLIAMPALFLTRTAYYYPHVVPWFAICVAIMIQKYRWIAVIILFECVFAVTTFGSVWNWDGVEGMK